MAKINKSAVDARFSDKRLAGGYGALAARQDAEAHLRRLAMTCLLWEGAAYVDGETIADQIAALVPQVEPATVAQIARQSKLEQKLRHVPLYIAVLMAKSQPHRAILADLLPDIIVRPDDIAEFMALYWQDGKKPIANAVKRGLATAFEKFDAYQLAKWACKDKTVKLKDVAFMVHPRANLLGGSKNLQSVTAPRVDHKGYRRGAVQRHTDNLISQLIDDTLPTPLTWETELSAGKDKKATWTQLITGDKLPASAYLKNLRNMQQANVDPDVIRLGLSRINTRWLLPLDYFKALQYAPTYLDELEAAMLRSLSGLPRLPGVTLLAVDVSGSMSAAISDKSDFTRLDAAAAMAVLAREVCETCYIYVTAGSDRNRAHRTKQLPAYRGFGLADAVKNELHNMGGGGIFTRQCLEYMQGNAPAKNPARIVVISDSQDCDLPNKKTPNPFGQYNYIIDVSPHQYGVNYRGIWTAEVSGWSEHFLRFIAEMERQSQ